MALGEHQYSVRLRAIYTYIVYTRPTVDKLKQLPELHQSRFLKCLREFSSRYQPIFFPRIFDRVLIEPTMWISDGPTSPMSNAYHHYTAGKRLPSFIVDMRPLGTEYECPKELTN